MGVVLLVLLILGLLGLVLVFVFLVLVILLTGVNQSQLLVFKNWTKTRVGQKYW